MAFSTSWAALLKAAPVALVTLGMAVGTFILVAKVVGAGKPAKRRKARRRRSSHLNESNESNESNDDLSSGSESDDSDEFDSLGASPSSDVAVRLHFFMTMSQMTIYRMTG